MRPAALPLVSLVPCLALALVGCGDQPVTRTEVAAPATSAAAAPAPAPAPEPAKAAEKAAAPAAAAPAPVVAAPAAPAAPALKPGLVGAYYSFDAAVEDWPTLAADAKPATRKVDATINVESTEEGFNGTALIDQFYVRWTGVLRAPKDGKYTLFCESDDGSRVAIGTTVVVDNGGLHPMEEKSGEIELKAGDHPLVVEFFENGGGAGCKFSWSVEGVDKQVVPASALYHWE
jgi:hypothetical protein